MGICPCLVPLLDENEVGNPSEAATPNPVDEMEEYKAWVLYDYEAKEAVQLTVYEKDIVTIRKVNQLGWCLALRDGKQGWIPEAYTRRINEGEYPDTAEGTVESQDA